MKVSVVTVKCDHPHANNRGSAKQDRRMAKASVREEHEAAEKYEKREDKAKSPSLKAAFEHAHEEEEEHEKEFAKHARKGK